MMQGATGQQVAKQHAAQAQAVQHASNVVSHLAAQHAANVVQHVANVHHFGHAGGAQQTPHGLDAFRQALGVDQAPVHHLLARAIAASMPQGNGFQPQSFQDQPQSMWSLANALSSLQQIGGAAASPIGAAGGAVASPFENLYGQMPWNQSHSIHRAESQAQQQGSNGNQSIFGP